MSARSKKPLNTNPWLLILPPSIIFLGLAAMIVCILNLNNGNKTSDRDEYRAALQEYTNALEVHQREIARWEDLRSVDSKLTKEAFQRVQEAKNRSNSARKRLLSIE